MYTKLYSKGTETNFIIKISYQKDVFQLQSTLTMKMCAISLNIKGSKE